MFCCWHTALVFWAVIYFFGEIFLKATKLKAKKKRKSIRGIGNNDDDGICCFVIVGVQFHRNEIDGCALNFTSRLCYRGRKILHHKIRAGGEIKTVKVSLSPSMMKYISSWLSRKKRNYISSKAGKKSKLIGLFIRLSHNGLMGMGDRVKWNIKRNFAYPKRQLINDNGKNQDIL